MSYGPPDLTEMAHICLSNSKRWFPDPHERGVEHAILHMALGIAGEAGEVVELVKKAHRFGSAGNIDGDKLGAELADVIAYCLNMAALFDIDMQRAFEDKANLCERRYQRRLAGQPETP